MICKQCGKTIPSNVRACAYCGAFTTAPDPATASKPRDRREADPENRSEQDGAIAPDGVRGWNWGSFTFTWIWGISNKVWLSLLVFAPIPLFAFVWAIVLGVKGNEWAWRTQRWDSIDQFKNTQAKWNAAGMIVFFVAILVSVGSLLYALGAFA